MKQNFLFTIILAFIGFSNVNLLHAQPAPPPGSKVISLTTTPNATVRIDLVAAASNTSVWIESTPGIFTKITVGIGWSGYTNYTVNGTTLQVYGNITGFDCSSINPNGSVKSLNASGNTLLTEMFCSNNQVETINVSTNTNLKILTCNNNQLESIDINACIALEKLYCFSNQLSSLNISNNPALKLVSCHTNNLSTQAIDNIYCQLPQRQISDNASIRPLNDASNPSQNAIVSATTMQNAINKNWKVVYASNGSNIPATTGNYVCGDPPSGSKVISLTVSPNDTLRIDLMAATANTPAWIETSSGIYTQVAVGTIWTGFNNYIVNGSILKIYGDITGLDCSSENSNGPIQTLDASGNNGLAELYCYNNRLSSINLSGLTALTILGCYYNQLPNLDVNGLTSLKVLYCDNNQFTSLDVNTNTALEELSCTYNQINSLTLSNNTALKALYCSGNQIPSLNTNELPALKELYCMSNQLSSLNLSSNTALENLYCSENQLSSINVNGLNSLFFLDINYNQINSLDISTNTSLEFLVCANNQLSSLDISNNVMLKGLSCYNNNFSTASIDQIFCQLPQREIDDEALICPLFDDSNASQNTIVLATNKQNAIEKNWQVIYCDSENEIPETTGNYNCITNINGTISIAVNVYPNPVNDILTVESKQHLTIDIYDINGKLIFSSILPTNHLTVNTHNWSKGVYMVKLNTENGIAYKKLIKK